MSIWHTQEVHDAAVRVLALHPGAGVATCALVEVTLPELNASAVGPALGTTTAALMHKSAVGVWDVMRLYTAEREIPGAVAVIVVGVW